MNVTKLLDELAKLASVDFVTIETRVCRLEPSRYELQYTVYTSRTGHCSGSSIKDALIAFASRIEMDTDYINQLAGLFQSNVTESFPPEPDEDTLSGAPDAEPVKPLN
jgi:hypothetical protein